MSRMIMADGGSVHRRNTPKKKAPRRGSVGAAVSRATRSVNKATKTINSYSKKYNVPKRSVGASAGARVGKAKASARVSVPVKKKSVARPKVQTYSPPVNRNSAPATTSVRRGRSGGSGRSGGTGRTSGFAEPTSMAMSSSFSSPAVVAPPKTPSDKEWLAGDSAYNDQLSEYDRALQEYLARIAAKEGEVNQDAQIALQSNARNQSMGLNNNAEDFAARGMINSGLFANSAEQLNDRYGESRSAIETNKGRQLGSLTDERDTYKRENELGRGNARRQALQRMAMKFGDL